MAWYNPYDMDPHRYKCGFCDNFVGPKTGYYLQNNPRGRTIYICSFCEKPTYFEDVDTESVKQYPGVAFGEPVRGLPEEVEGLYREARSCTSVGAYTSSVMTCRKILMNVAVSLGAPAKKTFLSYVDYLVKAGHVPPRGRGWVDHIRERGNVANHEIQSATQTEAEEMVTFVGMLLKMVYEFPARLPKKEPASP